MIMFTLYATRKACSSACLLLIVRKLTTARERDEAMFELRDSLTGESVGGNFIIMPSQFELIGVGDC